MITMADIAVHDDNLSWDTVARALTFVGETLENQAEFGLAADVYEVISIHFAQELNDIGTYWSYAAVAFKRNEDYGRAEECHVRALHWWDARMGNAGAQDWNIHHTTKRQMIENL